MIVYVFGDKDFPAPFEHSLISINGQHIPVLVGDEPHIQHILNNLCHGLTTVVGGKTNLGVWEYINTTAPQSYCASHATIGLCYLNERDPRPLTGEVYETHQALTTMLRAGKPVKVIRKHKNPIVLRNTSALLRKEIDPIARSLSELSTPKQIVIIKAMCRDLEIDLQTVVSDFFELDIEVEIIHRKAAANLIEFLKGRQLA